MDFIYIKKITGILNSKAINFVFGNSIYDFKLFNFGDLPILDTYTNKKKYEIVCEHPSV